MDEENGKEGRRNLSHRFERVLPGVGARAVRLEARPRPHGDEHGFVREIHGEAGVFARLRGELLKADVGVEHGEKRRLFVVRVENDLGDGVARCRAVENPSDELSYELWTDIYRQASLTPEENISFGLSRHLRVTATEHWCTQKAPTEKTGFLL